jgi:hypothetical protein
MQTGHGFFLERAPQNVNPLLDSDPSCIVCHERYLVLDSLLFLVKL